MAPSIAALSSKFFTFMFFLPFFNLAAPVRIRVEYPADSIMVDLVVMTAAGKVNADVFLIPVPGRNIAGSDCGTERPEPATLAGAPASVVRQISG